MRLILVLAASAGLTLGVVWLAGRLLESPAPTPTAAEAAASAKVDRNYRLLVKRLRARGRRVHRIEAARGAWARRANRICRRAVYEVKTAVAAAVPAKTQTGLFALVSKVEAIEGTALRQLRALPPPRHDAARVQKMLDLSDQALALDSAVVSALRRNDRAGARRLLRQEFRLGRRADAVANALGAYVCAEDPLFETS